MVMKASKLCFTHFLPNAVTNCFMYLKSALLQLKNIIHINVWLGKVIICVFECVVQYLMGDTRMICTFDDIISEIFDDRGTRSIVLSIAPFPVCAVCLQTQLSSRGRHKAQWCRLAVAEEARTASLRWPAPSPWGQCVLDKENTDNVLETISVLF